MKIPLQLPLVLLFFLSVIWAGNHRAVASNPSFSCSDIRPGSIEEVICQDDRLSELDNTLAKVYRKARELVKGASPSFLQAEQRGWIKGRDECWKDVNQHSCIEDQYLRRIAELQARFQLVQSVGPIRYFCEGDLRNEIMVTFFSTRPLTLIAERGDSVSIMYRQPAEEGVRYRGRNEMFDEDGPKATVTWGYGAEPMICQQDEKAILSDTSAILTSSTWQWVSFQSPVEEFNIVDPERYTIKFLADGSLTVRADCNRAQGHYSESGAGRISIDIMGMTRAACPPTSYGDDFVQNLEHVANYFLRDGDLYMDMKVDGGTFHLQPAPK